MAPPGCSCNQQAQVAAKGKLPRVAASQVMAGHHFAYLLAPASLPVLLYNAVIACTMAGSDLAETRVQGYNSLLIALQPKGPSQGPPAEWWLLDGDMGCGPICTTAMRA